MLVEFDRNRSTYYPKFVHYLLSFVVLGVATLGYYAIRNYTSDAIIALLFLLPVGINTLLWGLFPGVLSALLAFLAFNYFFIPPYYSFFVHQSQDIVALIVFLGVAVLISNMVGRTQHSLETVTAREREAVRLFELSTELATSHDDRQILEIIARQINEACHPLYLEVVVDVRDNQPVLQYRLSETTDGHPPPAVDLNRPNVIVPLQMIGQLVGEVRVWRRNPPFNDAEKRLLQTMASQGVLALERARLAQADTRARILEESDRLKSSLLSSVSHELRTPLATIKAAISSLRSDTVDWNTEARKELLEVVEEESDHLNLLVGNLLNMSRLEAGALKPERKWNVLAEIVEGVVERSKNATRRHMVQVDIPDDLPLVLVDYVLMEQVFNNLLSNSIKYSPEGTTVEFTARLDSPSTVLIQVSNEGPPVPREYLERIFDKFFRLSHSERVSGTGLGLSICKGIVEAHDGRIWAENKPAGLVFKILLPTTWEGKSAQPVVLKDQEDE